MPKWSGKTRGGLSGYKIFVFLLKYGGISTAYFVLRFVILYFVFFAPIATESSYLFFRKRNHFSVIKSYRYVLRNFYKLGQVLIDKVAFLSGINQKFTFDFEGKEHLINMAKKKGGVLIGAHAGNWEMAGHFLKHLNTKINIVVYADEHTKIQHYLSDIYMEQNAYFIVLDHDGYSHLYEIEKALMKNEIVVIHGDRYLPGANIIVNEFLGEEAKFPAGPFLIPVKYNVPVSFVSAMKESKRHYHFYATKPLQLSLAKNISERKKHIDQLHREYISNLERILKKYPDQWFNFYDFWEDNEKP